jgi:hypothetical protein
VQPVTVAFVDESALTDVGKAVGSFVGSFVGKKVGPLVGFNVGSFVGTRLGFDVLVGALVEPP